MNKLSIEQTELATEEMVSTVDFSNSEPLTMAELDAIVRQARRAQATVAVQIIKAVFNYFGSISAAIKTGIQAAATYDELAGLSDRELSDIGITRDGIARMAMQDTTTRAANAELTSYGYGMRVARPTNDWVDQFAA